MYIYSNTQKDMKKNRDFVDQSTGQNLAMRTLVFHVKRKVRSEKFWKEKRIKCLFVFEKE